MAEKGQQRKGVMIMLAGVLITTPDAVLLRWAQKEKAELSAIVFWKLLVIAAMTFVFSWSYEEEKSWGAVVRRPLLCCAIGLSTVAVTVLLSYAFVFTLAATAIMLFSLHPLWSGILGWLCLGDVLERRTVLALGLALAALVVMFFPEISAGSFGSGSLGDAMALATSLALSCYLCLARYASRVDRELSVPLVSALALVVAAAATAPIAILTGSTILLTPTSIVATLLDGLVVGAVNIANAVAPKYATATQVGLISLIEAVLSPLWVYAIYREVPDLFTFIGGAAIILILIGHELIIFEGPPPLLPSEDEVFALAKKLGDENMAISIHHHHHKGALSGQLTIEQQQEHAASGSSLETPLLSSSQQ